MKKIKSCCYECRAVTNCVNFFKPVCSDCLLKAYQLLNQPTADMVDELHIDGETTAIDDVYLDGDTTTGDTTTGDTTTIDGASFKGILHGTTRLSKETVQPWLCPRCNNSGSYAMFDGMMMEIKECECKYAHKPKTFGGTATIHG